MGLAEEVMLIARARTIPDAAACFLMQKDAHNLVLTFAAEAARKLTMADTDTFIPALYTPSSLLPIVRHRDALLYTIEKFPITILIGQTGSGKTTQLPQYLEEAGWCNDGKVIAITQASEASYVPSVRLR